MSTPILTTKLYIPPPRPQLVPRSRLVERLNEGLHRNLTLISAPAGFGKTTLVSEWVVGCERPVAWISLDDSDNDLTRFLAYLVVALQSIAAPIGEGGGTVRQPSQTPPIESVLTSLLNDIATVQDHFILVLDDYHVIEAQPIDEALTFLLDHLPPQMHLVIATREDPRLPLARLRVKNQMTELRAANLRFTPEEAAAFLNQVMGLGLTTEELSALETRTEGWIAGLQMAALSMQGRADRVHFINAFTGSHHFVLDYLVEEVLQRQPERIRSFLLQTAILERLSGPLCDAVSGLEDSRGMLEALERGNLFVVALDDQRQWYRYHHLFADVLQARLMQEHPDRVSLLHQRASEWYEQNGLPSDAVRHALAAEDFERAASLIELAWPAMRRSRREATMLGWLNALPDEVVRARPVLSVGYAWALLDGGEPEAAQARLRDAERWLDTIADMSERPEAQAAEMVVVDEVQFRSLPASITNARTYHAQAVGDVSATITYARRALDLLPESDYYERGTTAALLGLAYWASGELEAAHRSFADGLASLQRGGGILIAIGGTLILATIRTAQGRLREAASVYEQALQLATTQGGPAIQGTANVHLGLSELHREQGDLEAAEQHLLTSKQLFASARLPGLEYHWRLAEARLKEAQGDLERALDLFHEAELRYYRSPLPDIYPVAALKTRIWIKQGRLPEAFGWIRTQGLSVDDDLSYLREFEHVTLARLLIAQYQHNRVEDAIHQAITLLERLLQAAEKGGRMRSMIESLVLEAVAHQALGNTPRALPPLERALTLAEPEGYVRIFVDEGEVMRDLLRHATTARIADIFTRRLLSAFDRLPPAVSTPGQGVTADLAVPLTAREVEVLRLIAAGLRNQEIAKHLFISLSTVKRHIANTYGKLGVRHRTEAVALASELNLL